MQNTNTVISISSQQKKNKYNYFYHISLHHYKSVFGPRLKGIALSSVRKHRNSAETHMSDAQATLSAHHENVVGNCPL